MRYSYSQTLTLIIYVIQPALGKNTVSFLHDVCMMFAFIHYLYVYKFQFIAKYLDYKVNIHL